MNKIIIFQLILFYSVSLVSAQNILGPKMAAMGNNGAAITDVWSIMANTAGITAIQSPTLALNYANYFFDKQLSKQAVALIVPIQNNYLGLGFQRYGITEYHEIKAGFAYAKKFGNSLSIGIKANYHQLKISNYGQTASFSVDVGAMYHLNQQLILGLYFNNPALQKYNNTTIEIDIPTTFHIGATYLATNKVVLASTISKSIHTAIDVALGIDYQIMPLISLRGGLSLKPFKHYAGIGFVFKKLTVDTAIESDPYLGYSPQISLAYAF
ncbi:hypothetical protein [Pedobacter sp. Hv1]|uniref:hypothetical protein n=1 Tax=Pedobacter sp. Hv1 TaxID=1740090 RepID=UPI0006D89AFD|nr:hypothetical protein [Pedobacter sp. Hv1]KQC00669.1 hypothetical protein AQF98_08280 [Pedobacter sp. Hv1]